MMKAQKYKPFKSNDETLKKTLDTKKKLKLNENSDVTKRGGQV
jgi:hypothetical protein